MTSAMIRMMIPQANVIVKNIQKLFVDSCNVAIYRKNNMWKFLKINAAKKEPRSELHA